MRVERPVQVLLLTEDTGARAHQTLGALLLAMLRELAPRSVDCARHVEFLPVDERAREAIGINLWKARGPRGEARRRLIAERLATQVAREDGALQLAVVHVDADVVWSEGRGASENIQRFEREILAQVRYRLSQAQKSARAGRIVLLTPHYHLESWLYQNLGVLLEHYRARSPGGHVDLALLRQWQEDPGALDEVVCPKERLAVGNSLNHTLASEGFPTRRALEARKSFAEAFETLRACSPLQSTLRSLAAPWERDSQDLQEE